MSDTNQQRNQHMTEMKYLYGLPGDESLEFDPESVYENWACDNDGWDPASALVIEEWTSVPVGEIVFPTPDRLVEDICDWYVDNGDLTEDGAEALCAAGDLGEVEAAFAAALELWTSKCSYRQAAKKIRDLHVAWDSDGQPLLDGRPMYVKRQEIPGRERMFDV